MTRARRATALDALDALERARTRGERVIHGVDGVPVVTLRRGTSTDASTSRASPCDVLRLACACAKSAMHECRDDGEAATAVAWAIGAVALARECASRRATLAEARARGVMDDASACARTMMGVVAAGVMAAREGSGGVLATYVGARADVARALRRACAEAYGGGKRRVCPCSARAWGRGRRWWCRIICP